MKPCTYLIFIYALICPLLLSSCQPREGEVKDLKGKWRFSIGDNKAWAKPEFDDSKWDKINVPSYWESNGYDGYNGYAWYRIKFRVSKRYDKGTLYLQLGRIDDVDEIYLNGVLIGSKGSFPPRYSSAFDQDRRYYIPQKLIKFDSNNVIAVRVYDQQESGGIINNNIGIYTNTLTPIDMDLSGMWKFRTGDSLAWKEVSYADSAWKSIEVPGYYEEQGYAGYDGFSWYRRNFDLRDDLRGRKLVLVLGKVDDIDQVYINGQLIGGLGVFYSSKDSIETFTYYNEIRSYYIPDDVVINASGNVLAVRVFDSGEKGGIYTGHIGLISQDNYVKYWENRRKEKRW